MGTPWFVHLICVCSIALAAACSRAKAPPPPLPDRAAKKPRVVLTVLATAHEGAAVAPQAWQDAARMLGYWRTRESACAVGQACATLALSAGDHWARLAAADDHTLARIMRELGYAASVLGTADLQLGHDRVKRAIDLSGIEHVGLLSDLNLPESRIIERLGSKIEVIGLSRRLLPTHSGRGLLDALHGWSTIVGEHEVDAGIVLSDVCLSDLAQQFEEHGRAWAFLVLAIGQRCSDSDVPRAIHSVTLLPAGDGFREYGRATLTFDRNTGALLQAAAEVVKVEHDANAPAPDATLAAHIRAWTAQP